MSKDTEYRQVLKKLNDWIPYLLKESGLPGARGNLELAHAVAQAGDQKQFERLLNIFPDAKENTAEGSVLICP